jgi:hypothetical protein
MGSNQNILIGKRVPLQSIIVRRIQLLTIRFRRHAKKVITPLFPPDIKKRRSESGKFPGIKIDSGRIRNHIQEALIMSTIRNNLLWFDQIGKVKANRQLAKPQLTGTHQRIIEFIGG